MKMRPFLFYLVPALLLVGCTSSRGKEGQHEPGTETVSLERDGGWPEKAVAVDSYVDAQRECPQDHVRCDGMCVNTKTDPHHCGACGTTCGFNGYCWYESCVRGVCTGPPRGGCRITSCFCRVADHPMCFDLSVSREHCGGCNRACAPGQYCSEGTCRNDEPLP